MYFILLADAVFKSWMNSSEKAERERQQKSDLSVFLLHCTYLMNVVVIPSGTFHGKSFSIEKDLLWYIVTKCLMLCLVYMTFWVFKNFVHSSACEEIKSCWIDFENTKMQKDRAITWGLKQRLACSLQVDVEKGHRQALNQADKYLAIPHWAKVVSISVNCLGIGVNEL